MINLRAMTTDEFTEYLARTAPEYAAEKVKAGNWSAEEALQKAQETYANLLPQGVATPDNYLYIIEAMASGQVVGLIWMAAIQQGPKRLGFIYDLYIEEAARRHGYAQAAMLALEDAARILGIETLALHVFGHNHGARALYTKLGYEITNINMAKSLTS